MYSYSYFIKNQAANERARKMHASDTYRLSLKITRHQLINEHSKASILHCGKMTIVIIPQIIVSYSL